MATRATYTIKNNLGKTAHLYIHWDGYETGAAAYFYAALTSNIEGNGGFAERIIRAIPGAELTDGPEAHADTEFHYEIKADMSLHAHAWKYRNGERHMTPVFVGDIYSFINRYNEQIEDFKPFKPVTCQYRGTCWMNELTAKHKLECRSGPLRHLRAWSQGNINRGSANWQSCVEDLKFIIDSFPELMTEEIASLLA